MIVRDMKQNPRSAYEPIGFVDDDPAKFGQRIHDLPVLGSRRDLSSILEVERVHEVLVAVPRAEPATIRELVKALEPFRVPITTLPNFREIVNCKVAVGHIRSLSIEDLLSRAPVGLAPEPIRDLIQNRVVLVTGAGGSIGSELCRQIATFNPRGLVLFERYENGLYGVANDLADRSPNTRAYLAIGDVTDVARLHAVFAEYRPNIVFHAAAHKHVPLMELNPCEAVKNNVTGTRLVAEACEEHGVDRMILISSDKAVNPTSVMGATKRVAELNHLHMAARSRTRFATVRFGNVLGSNGSVVPRFLDQIKAGGPVTVTHPEIERYFMLIPEAVNLVLHAATAAEPGAIYVLDMGEPIKLLDMARNLIRLAGHVPDEEIPITFTGLRPGEKLYEELVGASERSEPAPVSHIFRVRSTSLPDFDVLTALITDLERLAVKGRAASVIGQLCKIIPTFTTENAAIAETIPVVKPQRPQPSTEPSPVAAARPAVVRTT
jgi:FlaA1/EpsC-like NDP-sugar epimerase